MQSPIYEKWWRLIRDGTPPPRFEDIPPAPFATLRTIALRLSCRAEPNDLETLLTRATQELARVVIIYNIATDKDHEFQRDYMVPFYIETIADLKAAAIHIQNLINQRIPLFGGSAAKEDTA
jgi:hypothetical protein